MTLVNAMERSYEEHEEEIIKFEASRLGTVKYWQHFYSSEMMNFQEYGDEGESWLVIHFLGSGALARKNS